MPKKLLIPIRNKAVTFDFPTWFLSDSISVEQIRGEDYATLHRDAEELYVPIVSARTTCIYFDCGEAADVQSTARSLSTQLQFVFRAFSSNPLLMSHAAVLEKVGHDSVLIETVDLMATHPKDCYDLEFSFSEGTTIENVNQWFTVVFKAVSQNPPLNITLSRFNSSLTRHDPYDKIIDLTISMESLIQSNVELKFRFALFHSIITKPAPGERLETFKLLKSLYNARSSIVHGDSAAAKTQKEITQIVGRLPELVALAQTSINYYLLFLYDKSVADWQAHLEGLALGFNKYINE